MQIAIETKNSRTSAAIDGSAVDARHATDATEAFGQGLRLMRRLVRINLGLAGFQAISAGLFLSGYGRAAALHRAVAMALVLGALIQAVTALILRRRRGVPAWVPGVSLGLFVLVLLQFGLGHNQVFWLHVP